MGHLGIAKEEVYRALAHRLHKNPVGAPLTETLLQILQIIFTEEEARIGSQFPFHITTLDRIIAATGLSEKELLGHLEDMAGKGLVVDFQRDGNTYYMLSPMVIGFMEYTFMRTGGPLPLPELAELFEKYHHEQGVAEEFFGGQTKMFQTWAYESLMPVEVETEVLDYEKASQMIRDAGGGALAMCYCRHQKAHLGTACDAPVEDVCTSLGVASEWLIRRGFARPATVDDLLRVLERTEELGLVHLGDNVQKRPAYICHCCGCCCGVLRSMKEDHSRMSVHPSNFIVAIDTEACTGCGRCAKKCHIEALNVVETEAGNPKSKKAILDEKRCIGCGACIRSCQKSAIYFRQRREIHVPPKNKKEQMMRIALEKGRF